MHTWICETKSVECKVEGLVASPFSIPFHWAKKMLNGESAGEEADRLSIECPEFRDPWPFRIKLNADHLRWDSLKISASKEFEEFISRQMNEDSRKALEARIPVKISIYDVDTGETYNAKMEKKESFWFDPLPCLGERRGREMNNAGEAFVYSIEPFRHIARRRDLKYGQEIGLQVSHHNNHVVEGLQFSVLYSPFLDIHCFRF